MNAVPEVKASAGAGATDLRCPPEPPPFWREVFGYLPELALSGPTLLGLYVGKNRMAPKLREGVILAVSRANRCAICTAAHAPVGLLHGLTREDLVAMEALDYARFTEAERAAFRYAVHLAQWRRVADQRYGDALAKHFGAVTIAQIRALARLFTWTNRINGAIEAGARALLKKE